MTGDDDLAMILGSLETPFVAERPFRNVAAELDALLGLGTDDLTTGLPPATDSNIASFLPPSDPFASFFSEEDGQFWENLSSTGFDWSTTEPTV